MSGTVLLRRKEGKGMERGRLRMLLFLGIALVLIGVGLIFLSVFHSKEVKGGGVIIIGPFPIVFGSDEQMVFLVVVLAILLVLVSLLIFFGLRG
ncbi:MAG: DUF131 domain-containing protein [Candidatus Hadarchaeales archaeon]